jgi:RND family efflux transporter MFP subunit
VGTYQADIVRWESEVGRLRQMVEQGVVNRDVLDETQKQLSSSRATRDAALAAVAARDAARISAQADLDKAKIDVETAKAQVKVAEADERRTAALLAYTKVTAPYDGVITVRNANTGDYVQAATGDKSTFRSSPMFVIARDDLVRIFVDVPEDYARHVRAGTKASVRAETLSSLEIKTAVARTSWSLIPRTRTLRAEIDLPTKNTYLPSKSNDFSAANDNGLRPGKYVNTKLIVERLGVSMLPEEAIVASGNQTYCYLLRDGKAAKTAVVPGMRDGAWIEVTKMKIGDHWVRVSGGEDVIVDHLDELTDGQTVKIAEH